MLLNVVVTSLEEHSQLSSLLSLGGNSIDTENTEFDQDYKLIEALLRTLLDNLFLHTVSIYRF